MSKYIFKNEEILSNFISYVTNKNLLSNSKLLRLRELNSCWKSIIEDKSLEIKRILKYQQEIRNRLAFDNTIYDQNSYKRLVIKNGLSKQYEKYKNLKIPIISSEYIDLDIEVAEEKTYFSTEINFPMEFFIFLQEYYYNPTVFVKIYPPEVIQKNLTRHKNKIRNYIIDAIDRPDVYQVIYLVPLCYSKHYRSQYSEKQYVTVLCFINVIDEALESDFPDISERYISLKINVTDLENNDEHFNLMNLYLANITKSILRGENNIKKNKINKTKNKKRKLVSTFEFIKDYCYPNNLAEDARSFEECFDDLISNQKFNI